MATFTLWSMGIILFALSCLLILTISVYFISLEKKAEAETKEINIRIEMIHELKESPQKSQAFPGSTFLRGVMK